MARLPLTVLPWAFAFGASLMACANDAATGALAPDVDAGLTDGKSFLAHDSGVGVDSHATLPDTSIPPPACPPKSTAGFTPAPYVAPVAHQGHCTAAEVTSFVTACGDQATPASCTAWSDANALGDAGTSCGHCIIAPKNNGGVWVDPNGLAYPNYGGCLQLSDPTHGVACPMAYDYATSCAAVACDGCSAADFAGCVAAADRGECSKRVATEETDCAADFADGGAAQTCTPGASTMTRDPDFTYIITLVCGP